MLAGMDTPTPDSSPLTLREIAAQLPRLEMACLRCGRQKRFDTDQLIARYGRDKPVLHLLRDLSGTCVWRDPVPRQNWRERAKSEFAKRADDARKAYAALDDEYGGRNVARGRLKEGHPVTDDRADRLIQRGRRLNSPKS